MAAYLQRILMDENVQYLILALIWVTSLPLMINPLEEVKFQPISVSAVALIPFLTFSVFHSLNYTRAEIIPTLVPPTSPYARYTARISPVILSFVQKYQSQCLLKVAYVEVWATLPYIVISIFMGNASFLTPLVYAQFLRFRYFSSPMTKAAFRDLRNRLDKVADGPKVPPAVKAVYVRVRDGVIAYGDVEAAARQAGMGAGAGPGPGPAAGATRAR
ncbi:hypothetical protein HK104_001902 [Borealophlyctis nickersoniae]|nr:hypothetical protein HK104_001902 [Borealophlyctis nickersoniae]